MNIKAFMALAVVSLTAACASEEPQQAPVTEVVEVPAKGTGGPCGDGRKLGENEVCP